MKIKNLQMISDVLGFNIDCEVSDPFKGELSDPFFGFHPLEDVLRPKDMTPFEKLAKFGSQRLSDAELLAVMLNNGVKSKRIQRLSDELLKEIRKRNEVPPLDELSGIADLKPSKAYQLTAMMEFGRRYWGRRGIIINGAKDVHKLVRHYADAKQEQFIVISLNGAHELIDCNTITVGLVDRTIVHPREVFADVIAKRACAICIAHNHPSGECNPSQSDDDITFRIEIAAELLGINFLDHLVFSYDTFFSYKENNKLNKDFS
ncbi:MAG: DNA repair protein RadC [Termitinemataceae bacterium]|nr:MAG: DNA repair protein RadC [Termitinemataceae bacterium]